MQLLKKQRGKIPHTNADKLLECKHIIYIITALSKVLYIYQNRWTSHFPTDIWYGPII